MGTKLIGDHLSSETKFLGTICPGGPHLMGTVCSGGPNWLGTICPWGQKVGDQKSGDQMGSGPNESQPFVSFVNILSLCSQNIFLFFDAVTNPITYTLVFQMVRWLLTYE